MNLYIYILSQIYFIKKDHKFFLPIVSGGNGGSIVPRSCLFSLGTCLGCQSNPPRGYDINF